MIASLERRCAGSLLSRTCFFSSFLFFFFYRWSFTEGILKCMQKLRMWRCPVRQFRLIGFGPRCHNNKALKSAPYPPKRQSLFAKIWLKLVTSMWGSPHEPPGSSLGVVVTTKSSSMGIRGSSLKGMLCSVLHYCCAFDAPWGKGVFGWTCSMDESEAAASISSFAILQQM